MLLRSVSLMAALAGGSAAGATLSPNSHLYTAQLPLPLTDRTMQPIFWALDDFGRDWYKVIGTALYTIDQLPQVAAPTATDTVVSLALDGTMPRESFTVTLSSAGAFSMLNVTGADIRGLVFGIYYVSGDLLAVDPWWWFHDVQPAFAGIVDVPAGYSYASGAPAFYSRGAFLNDEDTSGFFFADPAGDSVYAGSVASKYCEALLRLRCNTLIPSTFAYVDERHYRVAAARGLMLGNHHVMPVGNNVYAWPKGVAYTYRLSPEPFHAAWSALTEYQQVSQGREMVYSLGYRGINDEPFWNQDPACNTDQCRGATITQAIANQSAIALAAAARAGPGVPAPRFVSYLWMELLELFQAGTLHFPPGTATVFTDFPGSFNILGADNATAGDGFYAHLAMMSGTAAQLTEFIPLHRAFASIYAFFAKAATAYAMLNLSDMKQIPITAEAVYRYLWSPADFNSTVSTAAAVSAGPLARGMHAGGRRGPVGIWPVPANAEKGLPSVGIVTPAQAETAFLQQWCVRHYGATAGAAAAGLWARYFSIPYMAIDTDCTDIPSCNRGDHYLGATLRNGLAAFQAAVDAGGNDTKLNAALRDQAAALRGFALPVADYVAALWADTAALAATLTGGAATVFAGHSVAQTGVHHWHLQAFLAAAAGAEAFLAGGPGAATGSVAAALSAVDAALAALRGGETGVWRGVYGRETWTWVVGSRAHAAHLLATLQGLHSAAPPPSVYADYAFMGYECPVNDPARCNTYPLAAFNSSVAWDVLVRVACAQDVPANGTYPPPAPPGPHEPCASTFTGATVSGGGSAHIGLFIAPHPLRSPAGAWELRYTLDGSAPGPASPLYTAPLLLAGNATIRAQAFLPASAGGGPLGVPTLAQVA